MSAPDALWSLFLAGTISIAVAVAAFVIALVISQRKRITMERDFASRIVAAQEEERAWVASEVHDDALQRIAIIRHELDLLWARRGEPGAETRRGEIARELEELAGKLRSLAHRLHPALVEQLGLARALESLASDVERSSEIAVHVETNGAPTALAPATALALYRIAQEALHNVVKHSGAMEAEVSLALRPEGLVLTVSDAGRGFDLTAPSAGIGLAAMRQRAGHLGGALTVQSRPGGGTVVTVVVPVGSRQ